MLIVFKNGIKIDKLIKIMNKIELRESFKRQVCQIFSRVNGWYTQTSRWNKGKQAEWNDRKEYVIKKSQLE